VWLSCANHDFQLVKACLSLQKFSKYHRTNLTASENSDFKWAIFLSKLESRFGARVLGSCLVHKRVFVQKQIVVNRSHKYALQHQGVSHYFTSDKSLLKFRVSYEIVEPLFAEFRHTRPVEKVACLF